ncbi:RICIN domain-containing protein [Streptomyces thermocarboxydovorans]
MTDVLRLGGPDMVKTAQAALGQPAGKLRELADREHWQKTPLATAYAKDRDTARKEQEVLDTLRSNWAKPLVGLTTPAGFTETGFHWPPGSNDGQKNFYEQTGLSQWISERFWKDEDDFYADPTTRADAQTVEAVKKLGAPYAQAPDPGLPQDQWRRALAERDAFAYLTDSPLEPMGADNARIFLASGGFPRTAPEPGTAEFRMAVEDLKARFAACAWRDPMDPAQALSTVSATAAEEWQQEIASQAGQRDAILDANSDATAALATGAKTLGDLLGHSWVADRLARWQDYWAPGGVGAVGDAPAVIQVRAAKGKCLDVEGAKKTNGTPVQIYTCNGTAAQMWQLFGSESGLHLRNVNSLKCLDVSGNKAENGTKIQIWSCNDSPAQTWEANLRATTSLKNTGTGKCLDLHTFDNSHNAWLWTCNGTDPQKFFIKPTGSNGTVPPKAQFDKAKAELAKAQAGAKKQLGVLKAQAAAAKSAATASAKAEQAAYAIADQQGAPRGRGLLVGQQKAQVTQGAAAALEAMVKAGETAEAATRASAGDGETIMQRALAQAAQAKAEFRKKAAHAAELQAKAAADAAKVHRNNAKKDKETAEGKLAEAVKAEGEAKAAAATAHAKRLSAEAEEKTAKAEKEKAAAKQADAAEHRKNAEAQATRAQSAKEKAEEAESTAVAKRNAAVKARDKARKLRDDAWDAEQKADAARAKADAKEAYAQAHESSDNSQQARAAADQAAEHADDAETAAKKARSEADAATKAAAEADAAATRAEAAAKRARADADAAKATKLKADAAVKTATAAAADAIQAAKHAAAEAKTAVELADEAEKKAKAARSHANEARKEAGKAVAASARAAGFAYVTAQAAVDAGHAARQVAAPANDAIQLGSPYVTKDSAAALVVLTGQASKSIAEQQQGVAEAHARNAQAEAASAKSLADTARGDAKAAYVHAANAAGHASDARTYAKEALGHAADAATAASKAAASLARTIEYDRQATEDAEAADKAAGRAEGHAKAARDSADEAALDAEAARKAASDAEASAKEARAAAERADTAATEAEKAAKDAHTYAEEARAAAESAERKQANKQVSEGAGTGVASTFFVLDKIELVEPPKQLNGCNLTLDGCSVTFEFHFDATVSYYYCANPDVPATEAGCPRDDTFFLTTQTKKGLKEQRTYHFSFWEVEKAGLKNLAGFVASLGYDLFVKDFADCYHKATPTDDGGAGSGCAWAAATFGGPTVAAKMAKAVKLAERVEDAIKTGRDAEKVLADLKKIYGERVSAEDLADAGSAAGMGLRLAVRMADRAKAAAPGLDMRYVNKLREAGIAFDQKNLLWVVPHSRPGVPLAWLDIGDAKKGLVHIIFRHGGEFAQRGVPIEEIPKLLSKALSEGKVVGHQTPTRPIFETVYNGKVHRVAVTLGNHDKGRVIGANPA